MVTEQELGYMRQEAEQAVGAVHELLTRQYLQASFDSLLEREIDTGDRINTPGWPTFDDFFVWYGEIRDEALEVEGEMPKVEQIKAPATTLRTLDARVASSTAQNESQDKSSLTPAEQQVQELGAAAITTTMVVGGVITIGVLGLAGWAIYAIVKRNKKGRR